MSIKYLIWNGPEQVQTCRKDFTNYYRVHHEFMGLVVRSIQLGYISFLCVHESESLDIVKATYYTNQTSYHII